MENWGGCLTLKELQTLEAGRGEDGKERQASGMHRERELDLLPNGCTGTANERSLHPSPSYVLIQKFIHLI